MRHAAAFLLGSLAGSAAMAAYGWAMVPAPVATHRTLPRPAWTSPAPVPADDPLGRIAPQQLPTR